MFHSASPSITLLLLRVAVVVLSVGLIGCGQDTQVQERQSHQQEIHTRVPDHEYGFEPQDLPSEEEAQDAVAAAQKQIKADPELQTQLTEYPLKTCFMMPEDTLDEMAVEFVHEGRAMRLCCILCVQEFMADPKKGIVKLDEALDSAPR